jgi:hypothetical protein
MLGIVEQALRTEAILNVLQKQRDFFAAHPGAELDYQSPKPGASKHAVVIRVGTRSFSAEEASYEAALTLALTNAMNAYFRWSHGALG